MTTSERFDQLLSESSGEDLRAMVRAARLAMREYHSQVCRSERQFEGAVSRLGAAYAIIATLQTRVDELEVSCSSGSWVNNGGVAEWDRLTTPDLPVPF